MNKILPTVFVAIVIAVCSFVVAAQDPTLAAAAGDKYVISAKAGGVNFVEGTVAVVRKDGRSGRLMKGDTIAIGDRVSTADDGRAEILLNPGSYVRLGGNSAFEFKTTALDDLQLKLDRGSAIFEVYAGHGFFVTLYAPKAKFKLINSGIFRLDINDNGAGTLSVWKGRAQVGRTEAGIIKAGRAITLMGTNVSVAKFDRDNTDALDQWSKSRGKILAKMTNSLAKRELRPVLLSSFNGRQWDAFNSFGLWVYNRFTGAYCFLPFGSGWYSPYGYGYGQNMGWYDLPWTVYYPPVNSTPSGPTSSPGPVNTPIVSAGDRSPVPPFVRMQGGFGREGGDMRGSGNDPGSSPTYTPPTYSPPPTRSEPAPPPASTERSPNHKDGN